jgi:hypothetical protein
MRCCAGDGGLALRSRPAGGGSKPPQAAPVKSRGGKRCGKGAPRARQVRSKKANASEPSMTCRKLPADIETEAEAVPRDEPWGEPADCPGGVRHEGGASLDQAPARNMGTCRPAWRAGHGRHGPRPVVEGRTPSGRTARGRVPMRGTGADRPVVATKPGNAGGAKGAGHPGSPAGQPSLDGRSR